MIKPPGIIDNTIELPGRCYAIRMMPHEVDIADIHDKWDQAYADAMKLIVDGNVDEGKKYLKNYIAESIIAPDTLCPTDMVQVGLASPIQRSICPLSMP